MNSGELLSTCCQAEFDPLGFPREDGLWQEKCLKCGNPCEPRWFDNQGHEPQVEHALKSEKVNLNTEDDEIPF